MSDNDKQEQADKARNLAEATRKAMLRDRVHKLHQDKLVQLADKAKEKAALRTPQAKVDTWHRNEVRATDCARDRMLLAIDHGI